MCIFYKYNSQHTISTIVTSFTGCSSMFSHVQLSKNMDELISMYNIMCEQCFDIYRNDIIQSTLDHFSYLTTIEKITLQLYYIIYRIKNQRLRIVSNIYITSRIPKLYSECDMEIKSAKYKLTLGDLINSKIQIVVQKYFKEQFKNIVYKLCRNNDSNFDIAFKWCSEYLLKQMDYFNEYPMQGILSLQQICQKKINLYPVNVLDYPKHILNIIYTRNKIHFTKVNLYLS